MATRIVFLDTETTKLGRLRRAWEIGLIGWPDGTPRDRYEVSWMVREEDLDLSNADPSSLQIGRFHERHPQASGNYGGSVMPQPEAEVMYEVERLTRGAHIVGAVPDFDATVLDSRMAAHDILWLGHYHLIDVENLAVGWLAAQGHIITPPWNSADITEQLGIKVPEEDKHTALGDARWAEAIYCKVMGIDRPS